MKKVLVFLVLGLLFATSLVVAAELHTLTFTGKPLFQKAALGDGMKFQYPVRVYNEPYTLGDNTYYEFEMANHTEKILIDKIGKLSSGTPYIQFAVFIEGSELPYYPRARAGDSINVDFEFDEIDDLSIQVLTLSENETTLLLVPLEAGDQEANPHVFLGGPADPDITGGNETKGPGILPSRTPKTNLFFAALLVVILLFINHRTIRKFFVRQRNKRFKNHKKEDVKEEKIVKE